MQNMGINQLANMYMGNPQPLAQKVQQAQQQAKPGQIPADLEAAIALQKIQEMRNAAGNQQAMQTAGPQPTVVDQLKQMLTPQQQGMQPGMAPQGMPPQAPQQAAPQMPQVRAAHGGSIDHLASNLGHNYQGGGIIAFAEGGDDGLSERDKLRRMEAEYNPRTSEGLMGAVNESPMDASAAAQRILRENVMRRPEDERAAEEARARAAYGAPDTTGYDRAVAELTKRREKLEAPKTGMPALMEYLAQVAQAPRGMGSLSAGALGAQKVNEMQQQRESQQFDLTKQILEQEQKKIESGRNYAKEIYGVGKDTYDRMFKINYDAAKEIANNDMEARKMAATTTENQLNRASHEKIAGIQAATKGAPTFEDTKSEMLIQEYLKANPGKTRLDAMTEIATAKQGATPELRRAALVERLSEAWSKKTPIEKMQLAKEGITEKTWAKNQMELMGISGSSAAAPDANTVSMADVQTTAKSSGKTVAEVMDAMKAKGYIIK